MLNKEIIRDIEKKIIVHNNPFPHTVINDFLPKKIVQKAEEEFINLLKEKKVPTPRIKILPAFLIGRQAETDRPYPDEEYVTEKCFENYDITNLQCSASRMAASNGVYVCPILVDEPVGFMGNSIKETLRPFPLSHSACYTCRVTGMTCKN